VPDAVADWVRATLPRALGYAKALLRDPVSAEDVVQDCYARLLARAAHYDLPRDGLKLLLRSVTNACIDLRTRERALLSLDAGADGASLAVPDRSATDPHEAAVAGELAARIETAMAKLPLGQRAAIHLAALGYTLPEVAATIGTTHGNARVLVHRARQALEADLGPFLFGTST
jgi:RNA polymerase sigma-70 factor, ECF subfamily